MASADERSVKQFCEVIPQNLLDVHLFFCIWWGRCREQGTWKGNEDDQTVQQLAAFASPSQGAGRSRAAAKSEAAFALSDAEVSARRLSGEVPCAVCRRAQEHCTRNNSRVSLAPVGAGQRLGGGVCGAAPEGTTVCPRACLADPGRQRREQGMRVRGVCVAGVESAGWRRRLVAS